MGRNEDPFEYAISAFRRVYEQTRAKDDWKLWEEWNVFIVNLHNLIIDKCKERLPESLLYQRILDSVKITWLISFNIYSGAYRSAIRDLRFLLEATAQAYYLDKEFPNVFATEKVHETNVDVLYGRRLFICRAHLRKEIYSVYRQLCQYAHSSSEELGHMDEILMEQGMTATIFQFDIDLYNRCRELTIETIDAWTYIVLLGFPEITGEFKDLAERTRFNETLKKSSRQLCLSL